MRDIWKYLSSLRVYDQRVISAETRCIFVFVTNFFVLSSVLCLTLGRSSTTWPQASRATLSPTSSRPPTLPASPSTNLKHLCPAWPISPPHPTSPPTLQIPTLPPTWPLAPEETPLGWWPTLLEATHTSNPKAQDKSCCSRPVITVSQRDEIWFDLFMEPQKYTNQRVYM